MICEVLNRQLSEDSKHSVNSETIQTICEHMEDISTHTKADLYFGKGLTVFREMKDNLGTCCWQPYQQSKE